MPEMRLPDPWDGAPIVKVAIRVKNVGDGLSTAASTDPMTLHHGDEVDLLIRCKVASTALKPLDEDTPRGPQVADYILKGTGKATILDTGHAAIEDLLEEQQRRNDEAAGRPQLPLDGAGSIPAALDPEDDPERPSAGLEDVPDIPTDEDGYADPALES